MLKRLRERVKLCSIISVLHNSIMCFLRRTMDLGKVHQGVGRLIKVYVAYLKTLPRGVVMLSAKVSKGKERRGVLLGKSVEKNVRGVKIRVECQVPSADKLDP